MANEIDYDNMTDDQIDDILSQIDSGTFGSDDENQDGANTNLDENNENQQQNSAQNIQNDGYRTGGITHALQQIAQNIVEPVLQKSK